MKFSVVIPALNEEEAISRAIKSIESQDIPRNSFEIIVADNNSDDDTSGAAKRAGADKVVLQRIIGTNPTRQKGVEASRGKIVAFMDADCIAPPNWLSNIEKVISHQGVVAVSGPYKYKSFFPDFFMWRVYPLVPKLMSFVTGSRGGIILGGNFAAYRSAIDKIGGLPPLKFFGDDTAIAVLMARRAGRVVYSRRVWVESSPRRFKEQGFVKLGLKYFKHYFKVYFDKRFK